MTLGTNGSLLLDDALMTDFRNEIQILVDGVLHAERVLIGSGTPKNGDRRTTLAGNGRIAADVEVQQGLLEPGDDEGLRIFGDLRLSQETISRFILDNGDAQARLSVDSVSLSGTLEDLAAPRYDPDLDELVELITLNDPRNIAGQFDVISLPTTLSGKAFELSVTRRGVFLDPYLLGDFNADDLRNEIDIDLLSTGALQGDLRFDLNGDNQLDESDRVVWVKDWERTFFGDSDLDGEFNSDDLITVLAAGTYATDLNAGWASGDFDGSGRFKSDDLIFALADGGYEAGP